MTPSTDKWCLITGAGTGIGTAIAYELAAAGFSLVLTARNNIASAQNLSSELQASGTKCRVLQLDITQREQTRQTLENDINEHGAYYGVICNAGIADDAPFPAMSETQWDRVLHTDLDGLYNVLQPCVMPMIQTRRGGRIITISSVSGVMGNRGQVNYSAAKAGIIGATKALALELAKRKITVNCVAPGLIDTAMTADLPIPDEVIKAIPLRRKGTAKEVAATVAFLMSEGAAYITRQVINVNGGLI